MTSGPRAPGSHSSFVSPQPSLNPSVLWLVARSENGDVVRLPGAVNEAPHVCKYAGHKVGGGGAGHRGESFEQAFLAVKVIVVVHGLGHTIREQDECVA